MRRAFSYASYFAAGLLLQCLSVAAFTTTIPLGSKLIGMGVAALVAILLLLIGFASSDRDEWRYDFGIVLAVSMSLTLLFTLTFYLLAFHSPPELRAQFPDRLLSRFGDWITGGLYIAFLSLVGFVLLRRDVSDATLDRCRQPEPTVLSE